MLTYLESILDPANRVARNDGMHFLYLLWEGETIVYIGHTKNLEDRILAHKKSQKIFTGYSFHAFDARPDAINAERHLILQYKPKYNQQIVHSQHQGMTESERSRKDALRIAARERSRDYMAGVRAEIQSQRLDEMRSQMSAGDAA